ncbi:MAG: hypothetical protein AABY22_03685, partial [Nanoarchaeota archaeon]
MNDLLRYTFEDKYFLIWDLETECLNLKFNLPWQISWQLNKGYKVLEKHNYYIKWPLGKLNVSKGAIFVTGFDPQIVEREGRDPKEILDLFDSYLYNKDYNSVGSNLINFDCMVHAAYREIFSKKVDYSWMERLYDCNCLIKSLIMNIVKPKDMDNLTYMFKLNSIIRKGMKTNVGASCKLLDIPFNEEKRHDAFYDIFLSFEIFKKLIQKV